MTSYSPHAPGVYDPAGAHEIQPFIPAPGEHFALPRDITKAQAMATICAGLRLLGATEREIAVWRHIADITERAAWHSRDRAPVNFRRQCDMAREMGLEERHFRRIETRLERYGVLARSTADNGYRGRRSGQGYRIAPQCGLSLEPALANFTAFAGHLAEAGIAEEQRLECVLHLRMARRRAGELVAAVRDRETRAWAEGSLERLEREHRPPVLRSAEIGVLEAFHAALLDLEDRVREAMTPLEAPAPVDAGPVSGEDLHGLETGAVEKVENQAVRSAAPDSRVRRHIQPQINHYESCNALKGASKSTPAKAGDRHSAGSPPFGGDHCLEYKAGGAPCPVNPEILAKLTTEKLRNLASEDAALYLDACQDWRDAVPLLLRELGVNISAWLDAADIMGEEVAFLALLVLDRNRFHPVTPVRSPGGALRAMTRRAAAGELNLTRAILGIWERERQGRQPKAKPRPERLA